MTTRTLRALLPALLVALAACVVSTDDLKPKTDAECQAQNPTSKACGPRCVSFDDPATGCSAAGCSPCPGGPSGWVAFCNAGICDLRMEGCEPGKVQCDGVGGCEDLLNDALHCGACGHRCFPSACVAGECTAAVSLPADPGGAVIVDLAAISSGYIYLMAGGTTNGRLVAGGFVTSGLGNDVDRLVSDAAGNAYVSRVALGAPITHVPFGGAATPFFTPEGVVLSMALGADDLWITTMGGASPAQQPSDLLKVPRLDATAWASVDPGVGALAGVGYAYLLHAAVFGSDSGALGWSDGSLFGTYATGLGRPGQIAVYEGPVGADTVTMRTVVFWASEADGSVWSMEVPGGLRRRVQAPIAATGRMDLWADGTGVYWSDRDNGIVGEWRPVSDDVVVLHTGGAPNAVIQYSEGVYWADQDGAVRWVPR